eukprot:9811815-Alexandrium_andersonii.AAC.1
MPMPRSAPLLMPASMPMPTTMPIPTPMFLPRLTCLPLCIPMSTYAYAVVFIRAYINVCADVYAQ